MHIITTVVVIQDLRYLIGKRRASLLPLGDSEKSHFWVPLSRLPIFYVIISWAGAMARRQRMRLLALIIVVVSSTNDLVAVQAQQSAAGHDTLIGIVGRGFVMMGADSSSSGGGGIALTSMNVDKIAVIHDGWTGGLKRRRLSRYCKNKEGDDDRASLSMMTDDDDRGMLSGPNDDDYNFNQKSLEQQAIAVGFAGDAADADRLIGLLKTHLQVREYEAGIGNDIKCVFDGRSSEGASVTIPSAVAAVAGMDAEAIANLSRNEIAGRLRSRQPLQLCLLVGGMVRCSFSGHDDGTSHVHTKTNAMGRVQKQISYKLISNNDVTDQSKLVSRIVGDDSNDLSVSQSPTGDYRTISNPFLMPKLFWLDQYGSLQNMPYASHGFGSNFAYSILDQRYHEGMSKQEASDLILECFDQLRQRYVINSPKPPRIKCIDNYGVTEHIRTNH